MSVHDESDLPLEIGHVLFMDICDYSKLLINEQSEVLQQLKEVVSETEQFRAAATEDALVRLPTGDGMALVFRNHLEAPAQCALQISKALRAYPHIHLRMGVHSGPVNIISDVNERANVTGAGINMAQRVMDCGDAGHILLSKRVADDLEQYRRWQPHLHYLGECQVKHGVTISLANLFTDEAGNPKPPKRFAGTGPTRDSAPARHSSWQTLPAELRRRNVYRAALIYALAGWLLIELAFRFYPTLHLTNGAGRWLLIALVLGLPLAVALAWWFDLTPEGIRKTDDLPLDKSARWPMRRKIDFALIAVLVCALGFLLFLHYGIDARSTLPEKSIAVLPFENLSNQKDNAFFADGLQDDLLTNLAKIKDLKVISRTSVMKYRDAETRDISEIAHELGVANILEGSVRRVGNRIAVNAQLIDTRTDRHIWANKYDRTLADSLGIEGELATEIADALRARLTPEEKSRVVQKPTQNADAYDLYLRALPYEQGPDTLLVDYKRAEQLYSSAIQLDPNFALAHARLASTCAEIFHFHEPLDTWKTKALGEAQTALRLQPNLMEAHFALGQCYYWLDQDYEAALREFGIAQDLSPSNANIGLLVGAIRRRQGRWEETLRIYEKCERLDPQNPNIVRNLLFTNTAMRRWKEASRFSERLRQIAPDSIVARIQSAYVSFWWKGDVSALRRELSTVAPGRDPDGVVTACRWEAAMLERNFAEAQKVVDNSVLQEVSYLNGGPSPLSFFRGCIGLASGDMAMAKKEFEAARPSFEEAVQEAPDSAERHANLGLFYAFSGRKEDAIREGRVAVELRPQSKDAVDGTIMRCFLALIYARCGEPDQAFPLLQELLHTPGAVDSVDYSVTVNDLKYRWEWDPLRKDPRFAKLLETKK